MANGNYKVSLGVDLKVSEIREKINQFNANNNNAKLRLGVKLDTKGLAEQIKAINYKTPVKLAVKFDTKTVQSQINNIRRQLQQLGNIRINLGGAGTGIGGRQDIQTVRIARSVDDVTRAYRELISIQNRMGSKQQAVAKLDTTKNKQEIIELSNQIDTLARKYQRIHQLFSGQFSSIQIDTLNRNFEITAEKLNVIRQKALDTKASLDRMNSSGSSKTNAANAAKMQADEMTRAYNKLKNISQNISSIKTKLSGGLNTSQDAQQIKVLEAQLQSLTAQYHKTVEKIKGKGDLSGTQWQTIQHQIDNTKLKLDQLSAKVIDAKNKLANGIQMKLGDGTFNNQISSIQTKFNALSNQSSTLRSGIDRVRQAMSEMQTAAGSGNTDALIAANQRYQIALKSVENQLRINARAEQEANNAANLKQSRNAFMLETNNWLQKNSAAAAQFGSRIRELQKQVANCDKSSLARLRAEFSNIKREAALAGKTTQTFGDRIKAQFQRYSAYFSVASVIMLSVRALRSMFEQVKAVDSAMVELKKVTSETNESYNQFLTSAASKAKELGTTIDGLIKSAAGFARLGYGFAESQKLAEVANIYSVVGDEVEGVEGATKSLISTMAAFKEQQSELSNEEFAMDIVDKFNEIGNNFAISSGGIGDALQRSASSLAAANNTVDESIALITAANTVVQNPEVVGTAFKTMSMRIRGARSELEEAGLETEGMAKSTAKLREEIEMLSGVDIMEADNKTFKSTYKIMDELAAKWQDMSDIQQATITELIAGKRQGNVVSSLMTNFDTARQALETSINSEGSAMAEHEKWMQSIEAGLNRVKAAWQSLSQSFLKSNFLKGLLKTVESITGGFGKLIDSIGTIPTLLTAFVGFRSLFTGKGFFNVNRETNSIQFLGSSLSNLGDKYSAVSTKIAKYNSLNAKHQMQFCNSMKSSNTAFGKYIAGLNGGKASMSGYIASLVGAKVATFALQVATMALNMALTMGISWAVSKLIEVFDKLIVTASELSEEVDELTSKFKEQHNTLVKGRSSFDAEATRYAQLSKGVDQLGRNVSLTTDEYSEYQSVVNKIAEQIPSLISGYDDQGNAILEVKGNVDELIEAYEKLLHVENNKILSKAGDIEKNFKNTVEDSRKRKWSNSEINADDIKFLEKSLTSGYDDYHKLLDYHQETRNAATAKLEYALENAGVQILDVGGNQVLHTIVETVKNDPSKIKGIIESYYAQFDEVVEQQKTIAQAKLSEAFDVRDTISGLDYGNISDNMQNIVRQMVNDFDYEFFTKLIDDGTSVESYIDNMLKQLGNLDKRDSDSIDAAFNLQTKFNNADISYGEFVHGLEDAGKLIDTLNLTDEIKSQLKLTIGLNEKGLVEEYEALIKRITTTNKNEIFKGNIIGLGVKEAEKFIDSLSTEELSVITDIIPELDANATVEQIQAAINREMAVRGLHFDLDLEDETTSIDAFNTALQESASAIGLSTDSIKALRSRYKDLEADGYNLSDMFEETSNGIHLNRKAVRELEKAYAEQKQSEIKEDIEALKKEYDLLTKDIEKCNDASERASLYVQRDAILQQINDAATLASAYDGLTSSYNDWLAAEKAGQERDMYEKLIEGFENVDDELSRGWLDDGTIEFLELLTGRDLTTAPIEDLKKAYKDLDKEIKNSGYSIRDFFTVNEDGDSTNTGVYNFLETIESLGGKYKDSIKKKNGKIVGFDFEIAGGDEAVAEALGISEELVEIMLRAADDAGFVVNLEGAWTQLADLKTEAETARDTLIDLKNNGLDKLKDFDVNFDLSADGKDLLSEQEKAVELLDKFRNTDGTINLKLDGAQQALDIAEYLTIRLDDLTEPRYMQVDTSILDEDIGNAVEQMQEFERLSKEKHLLSLTGDTKGLENVNAEMDKIAEYLYNIEDAELKKKLDIEGLDTDEIKKKLEAGEIELAAELNLDVQMSDDLKDIRLMMMNQLGIVSDNEIKLKLGYDIDDSLVNKLTDSEQEVVVKYFEEHKEVDNYTPEQKEAIVKYLVEYGAVEQWSPQTKEAFVEYFVDEEEIQNYTPEMKQALAKYIVDGNDVTDYTPEMKQAIAKYLADGGDVSEYTPEEKKAFAKYLADGGDPDKYQAPDKDATVNYQVNDTEVQEYKPSDFWATVWLSPKKAVSDLWNWATGNKEEGGSGLNGTAHAYGTSGRAFKQGDWRTKKSERALVGELGREIVVTPDNRWHTVGDNGAEFTNIPRGSIVFNHRQTEELLANGKVVSGGGRGKAYAGGNSNRWTLSNFASNDKENVLNDSVKNLDNTINNLNDGVDNLDGTMSTLERALAHNASLDGAPMMDMNGDGQTSSSDNGTWFQAGAFRDGVTAENAGRAYIATTTDASKDAVAGGLSIFEALGDTITYIGGSVMDFLGKIVFGETWEVLAKISRLRNGKFMPSNGMTASQQNLADAIAENAIDEQAIANTIVDNLTPQGVIGKAIGVDTEKDSVLGDKSDALMQSAGQLAVQYGLQSVGVPWFVTSGVSSFGGEVENALNNGATLDEAGMSAAITAGAEILSEKLFGGDLFVNGGGLLAADALTSQISRKALQKLASAGINIAGEGFEEAFSQFISNLGSSLYRDEHLAQILFDEQAMEGYLDSAIGGWALGGVMTAVNAATSTNSNATTADAQALSAYHNIWEEFLAQSINSGGFVSPSVALKKYGSPHTEFGDYTAILDMVSINPELDSRNKVYGADAWTPTQTKLKKNAIFDDVATEFVVNGIRNSIGENYFTELFPDSAKDFKASILSADGSIYDAYAHNLGMQAAYAMQNNIISDIPTIDGNVDTDKLMSSISSYFDTDGVWRQYKEWLSNISDTIIKSYDVASNEDILTNMLKQPASAKPFKLSTNGELVVPAIEYTSMQDMIDNYNRLSDSPEYVAEQTKLVSDKFMSFANDIHDATDVDLQKIVDVINQAFENRYSSKDIQQSFSENDIEITRKNAEALKDLYRQAVELPTEYFEAKPQRIIGIEEIKSMVVPSDISSELLQKMLDAGLNVVPYKVGDTADRVAKTEFATKFSDMSVVDAERAKLFEEARNAYVEAIKAYNDALSSGGKSGVDIDNDAKTTLEKASQYYSDIMQQIIDSAIDTQNNPFNGEIIGGDYDELEETTAYSVDGRGLDVMREIESRWATLTEPKSTQYTVRTQYVSDDIPEYTNPYILGNSFAGGSTGLKANDDNALVGELGRELVVDPQSGRYYTVGDNGAEMVSLKRGSIIFNHKQTEDLLKNGRITSRGKAFAEGNAFAYASYGGGGGIGKVVGNAVNTIVEDVKEKVENASSGDGGGTDKNKDGKAVNGKNKNGNGSSSKKDFKESFDWIEVAIDRIERAIDSLDQRANNIYKSWSDRNSALTQEIGKVREEVELQEDAAQRYLQEANKVGLSESWAKKVRDGEIDINTIKDEKLAEKIKDYQTWYEKYLGCIDAAEKLRETEAKLYAQRVENVATQYEGILGVIEHEKNILDEYISQNEANAQLVSVNYYNALANNERANLSKLEEQKAKMIAEMQAAMASGTITEGSEAWYDMVASIDKVTLAIAKSNTQLVEYDQTIQQLSWESFDLLQERISSVTEETEFLIELMSSDKLYDDNGQLTNSGMATMGQHGVAYNAYMYQAELASAEAARLKAELAKDPFDTKLEERYREMVSLQQEHILAAQGEKEAIREMVEEGINLELDALQERIDKYNEAIESQKELYDYQNKVKEQTEEIASLEKQMASYAGDTSEEAKAKIQELKVSLDDAKSELEETEYDKRISDQQQMLDELYEQYEEVLNTRLDNLDALVSDMITQINTDATSISTTLSEKVDSVGYTLSESMNTIWDANSTKINGVIADYGNKFMTAQTTTNNALNTINANLQNMIGQLNSIAKTKVKAASISSIANPDNPDAKKVSTKTQQPEKTPTTKTVKVGGKIDAGNAKIYDYAGDKSGETQYFKKDPVYKVLAEKDGYLKVLWHKLSSGVTGWFKKSDVKALATGAKRIDADDMAWTQEKGREFIVRPSDGAILTPVAKGDSVLNATASGNIWSMANSPAEFIRDNLNLNATSVPNNSNVQNNYTQHLDKVVFNFPNVKNYDDMLSAMQKDKNFERLVLSMSVDRIAGKSSLAKGKSIR